MRRSATIASGCILLVPDARYADRLRNVLRARDPYKLGGWIVEVLEPPIAQSVRDWRSRAPEASLGVVVSDEVAGLDALGAGADEVLVGGGHSVQAMNGFVDRTRLRANRRREAEQQRREVAHAQRLASLGTLLASVAHEINNPLTAQQLSIDACARTLRPLYQVARGVQELAGEGRGASAEQLHAMLSELESVVPETEGRQLLSELLWSVGAIGDVVRDLRLLARPDTSVELARPVEVNEVVRQALRLTRPELEMSAAIELQLAPDISSVLVAPGRLTQVLLNVLINAAQAMRDIPGREHRLRVVTQSDGETVAICISDTGPGISAEDLERVFDPFFTTKRAGVGTGLGLSISRSIMREFGGDLIVESIQGSGATFVLLIPMPDADELEGDRPSHVSAAQNQGDLLRRNVLAIDPDERILRAYARALGSDCNLLVAGDGAEAVQLLASGCPADVILCELNLPYVDGPGVRQWLRDNRPELVDRMLFIASDFTQERYRDFLETHAVSVLGKPTTTRSLVRALCAVMEPPAAPSPARQHCS